MGYIDNPGEAQVDQDEDFGENKGMDTIRINDILQLSVAERLSLVEKIWDSIAAVPAELPLTEAQHVELDRRLQAQSENPEDVETWDDVKAKIRRRK
jgi:putative addiction module component (TIGR02574 family)